MNATVCHMRELLTDVYGENNVTIIHGILGDAVQVTCPRPDTYAVVGLIKGSVSDHFVLAFHKVPDSQWGFETDVTMRRKWMRRDCRNTTTEQFIQEVTEVIG